MYSTPRGGVFCVTLNMATSPETRLHLKCSYFAKHHLDTYIGTMKTKAEIMHLNVEDGSLTFENVKSTNKGQGERTC